MSSTAGLTSLAALGLGRPAVIKAVGKSADGKTNGSLERRLLELGFAEGREVEIRHVGPFGGDPLAVRVDRLHVAIRKAEAAFVIVEPLLLSTHSTEKEVRP